MWTDADELRNFICFYVVLTTFHQPWGLLPHFDTYYIYTPTSEAAMELIFRLDAAQVSFVSKDPAKRAKRNVVVVPGDGIVEMRLAIR